MLWTYLKNQAKRAVLEGVSEATEALSQPGHEREIRAPVAVVLTQLEAQLRGLPGPAAIPLGVSAAAQPAQPGPKRRQPQSQ